MINQIQTAIEAAATSARMAWGDRAQVIKACEEMGELTTALCKRLNGSPVSDESIVDEVADVLVMANQMRLIYGEEQVDARIKFKLERTIAAIERQRKEGKIK